jgi:hypothetical protein
LRGKTLSRRFGFRGKVWYWRPKFFKLRTSRERMLQIQADDFFNSMQDERDTTSHPVWTVYNELRTARLNIKYEQFQLDRLLRLRFWSEFIIKFAAVASIGGLSFMKTNPWALCWTLVGVAAAIMQIIQACFRLDHSIAAKQKSISAYGTRRAAGALAEEIACRSRGENSRAAVAVKHQKEPLPGSPTNSTGIIFKLPS